MMALAVVIAAAFFMALRGAGWYLVLRNADTGQVYASYPVQPGDRFAIGFRHSVNKYPLTDVFEISEDYHIYAQETYYYSYGAGVQTELNEGETFRIEEDGAMVVGNINNMVDGFRVNLNVITDHTLMLGDISPVYTQVKEHIGIFTDETEIQVGDVRVISMNNLCGEKLGVVFTCEHRWL